MNNKVYWRRLVVRAIEDACILLMMGVGLGYLLHRGKHLNYARCWVKEYRPRENRTRRR